MQTTRDYIGKNKLGTVLGFHILKSYFNN
jgi:hypothetical protein